LIFEALSWIALAFVVIQLWLMGSNRYRAGWWCAIAACVFWSVWAFSTEAWAMLVMQGVIATLSVRALRNLED
jgi:hypothetical protein